METILINNVKKTKKEICEKCILRKWNVHRPTFQNEDISKQTCIRSQCVLLKSLADLMLIQLFAREGQTPATTCTCLP